MLGEEPQWRHCGGVNRLPGCGGLSAVRRAEWPRPQPLSAAPPGFELVGVPVALELRARRFFCDQGSCAQGTFAEPLGITAPRYARRSARAQNTMAWLGVALGGEGGARAAARLGIAASGDTVLRTLRQLGVPPHPPPRCSALMIGPGGAGSATAPSWLILNRAGRWTCWLIGARNRAPRGCARSRKSRW